MPSSPELRKEPCIAFIVDMVKSRALPSNERPQVQTRFQDLVNHLNKKYPKQILSRFVITLGDEFQGLLRSAISIPDIISDMEEIFPDRVLRVGVGFGLLYTPVPKQAINVDGPALHNARSAIEKAKDKNLLGGVFEGFGDLDKILNGITRILWFHRSQLTSHQRTFFTMLLAGDSQTEIAHARNISRQAVSKQVMSAGWQPYMECEAAWRLVLQKYVEPMIGDSHL